jgi:hypothetical protein
MAGYSEVINVIGAMIIFSMILLNANSMIIGNSIKQVEGELEYEVIALGQEIIEEALSKSFDQVTVNAAAPPTLIPGGFTPSDQLGPDTGEAERTEFNDFDDYNGWSGTFQTEHGEFELSAEVFYVDENNFEYTTQHSTFKKIEVTVLSEYLVDGTGSPIEYKLEFIRNYYAD